MRAHVKRRQRRRQLTILGALLLVGISLVAGFYVALNSQNTANDKFIGKPVSATDQTALYQLAHAAYGPSGASLLTPTVLRSASGLPFFSGNKPVLVYIGAEYCPFCAIERWSMVVALSRFGNFSDLRYSTSGAGEGDYATFTFVGSKYTSSYISFQAFEQRDRNNVALETVPANYTVGFPGSYPFLNFGNRYLVEGSLIADPGLLGSKNWTSIITSIRTGDNLGIQISMGANDITALICKITNNSPSVVCNQDPIPSTVNTLTSSFSVPGTAVLMSYASFAIPSKTNYP